MLLEEQVISHEGSVKALMDAFGLTLRESEVLFWVVQGKTDGEVATILGLSPRTVHKHLEHIYKKLGCENRAAAMVQTLKILGVSNW